MKRYIIVIFLFIGCHRDPGRSGGSLPGMEPPQSKIIVFMGQSNVPALLNGVDELLEEVGKYQSLNNIHAIYCSQGGTDTSQWIPGTPLYISCLEQIKAIPNAKVWALLFMQGENNAQNCTPWHVHFDNIVAGLKSDTESPDMATVWERLNSAFDPTAICLSQVRLEQEMPMIRGHYVDLDGIPMAPGAVHYGNEPEIGRRFGKTLGPLLN